MQLSIIVGYFVYINIIAMNNIDFKLHNMNKNKEFYNTFNRIIIPIILFHNIIYKMQIQIL